MRMYKEGSSYRFSTAFKVLIGVGIGLALVVATVVGILIFNYSQQGSPAGNDNSNITTNHDKRLVYENPEDYANLVVFCDGTTRIYLSQREQRPIILVLDDVQCGGKGGHLVYQPQ